MSALRDRLDAEFRARREWLRQREEDILTAVTQLDPDDQSLVARHLRECAEQIRDHRAAGNYTTNG